MTGRSGEGLLFETVTDRARFAGYRDDWDGLVASMPRPSPFLLHDWVSAWWKHHDARGAARVALALRGDRIVAALPLFVSSRARVRVASFLGGADSALADLLLADGEDPETARLLVERVTASGIDFVDVFGLPADSRLAGAAGARLSLVPRVEAPVVDIQAGWEAVYKEKISSKQRSLHRRRRRQLAELGHVEVTVARSADELSIALEDAFELHALRWRGRPDGSEFVTRTGMAFHREAIRTMAALQVPRIVTLKLDGRAIAFHYYLAFCGRMYVHGLAFDPALGKYSPGLLNTYDAIEVASRDGLRYVEFLGGAERYKAELADRFEPMHQGIGLARGPVGAAMVRQRRGMTSVRKRLKQSARLRRLYFESMAPVRRAIQDRDPRRRSPRG